jgi:hypothetical protein
MISDFSRTPQLDHFYANLILQISKGAVFVLSSFWEFQGMRLKNFGFFGQLVEQIPLIAIHSNFTLTGLKPQAQRSFYKL